MFEHLPSWPRSTEAFLRLKRFCPFCVKAETFYDSLFLLLRLARKMKSILHMIWLLPVVFTAPFSVFESDLGQLGHPENNILSLENRDKFTFSISPTPPSGWGHPRNVADERQHIDKTGWSTYGVQVIPGKDGIGYIQEDLKTKHVVRAFAITGYAGGSHKPSGEFFLEGSNNGHDWRMVAVGKPEQWHAPGTYPFRKEQIIPALYPNAYRYYRVIAKGWANTYMLIYNWGLFS